MTFGISEDTTFRHLRLRVIKRLRLPSSVGSSFDIFPVVAGYERRPRTYLHEKEAEGRKLSENHQHLIRVARSIRDFKGVELKYNKKKDAIFSEMKSKVR